MNETKVFEEGAMEWNDSIELDAQENRLIEGEYIYTVSEMVRGRFPGSEKLPPCNKASVTLEVVTPDGDKATCRCDFIMCRSLEWKLSAFFRSIGQKKEGERMTMDWTSVVGAQGRAIFKPYSYQSKYGGERSVNAVARFLDYDASRMPDAAGPFVDLPKNFDLPF